MDPTELAFAVARRWRSEIVTGAPSDTLVRRGWGLGLSRLRITFPHCKRFAACTHPCRRCWFQAQDGVLGRAMTPPRTRASPPLEGKGQAATCTGLQFVLPLVRKSPVSRLSRCVIGAHTSRQGCGHRGGARRVQMHDSGELVHPADVRSVRVRLSDRRARCLCASASSLCVGCC